MHLDWELEDHVARLEQAWEEHGSPDLKVYLPAADHPRFNEIAMELVRVDAELAISAGMDRSVGHYLSILPGLMNDRHCQQQLAFELARLSMPQGVSDPYPEIGDCVAGFELLGSIGQGAFSRVYIAAESLLARRLVVLKFSTKFPSEAGTLARLQHKNIVPIYSWHRHKSFHVVCMPYLGSTTLWDFLKQYRTNHEHLVLGQAIVSTLNMRRSQTLASASKGMPDDVPSENTSCEPLSAGLSREIPKLLASQDSHQTLLWIGKELAEGLMHAHDRGVLHRDIKPANILLADEGTPMLLDFNLASSTADDPRTLDAGGTPRYMSPEQLQRMLHQSTSEDARSDLYALGVVLFELATGRTPFTDAQDTSRESVRKMLESRQNWSASSESWPGHLPQATIDIISKLLAYDPAFRYQSAADLFEDITRQLQHQPLRHNRNRSVREFMQKWMRRHPRIASGSFIAGVLGGLLALSAGSLVIRQRQIDILESKNWLVRLENAQLPAQALLSQAALPSASIESLVHDLNANWVSKQVWNTRRASLDIELHPRASQLLGQLLAYRARGKFELGMDATESPARQKWLREALQDSMDATELIAIGKQSSRLLTEAIRKTMDGAGNAMEVPALPDAKDLVAETEKLVQLDVANPWYWWNLGQRKFEAGDAQGALSSAQVADMLDPSFKNSKYLSALIEMDLGKFDEAKKRLTGLIDGQNSNASPVPPEAFMNRAICFMASGQAHQALEDLNRASVAISRLPRIYFLREQAARMLGDIESAQSDLQAGLSCQPTDALGWASRGDARMRLSPPDPVAAIDDYRQAQLLGPKLKLVYNNMAFILADVLGRRGEAIEVLTKGIEQIPQYPSFYSARAVYRARQGELDSAKEDAQAALQLDRSPMVCYQAASALLVATPAGEEPNQEDRELALDLLKETLRKQPELRSMMETDSDLESLRGNERFHTLLKSAATLQ